MFGPEFDIMIYVRDMQRSVDFYSQVLGYDFEGWWSKEAQERVTDWSLAGNPGYAQVTAGPLRLSLHANDEEVPTGGIILHLQVEDVDAFYERVASKGVEVSEPRDEPWGWRMMVVDDPDGHQWGFYRPQS